MSIYAEAECNAPSCTVTVWGSSMTRWRNEAEGTGWAKESAGVVAIGTTTTRFSASLLYGDPSRARELLVSEHRIGFREGLERLFGNLRAWAGASQHQDATP